MARIFLIEVDPDFAECLRRIFEIHGYEVGWAANVPSAVPDITEFPPSLTIVDMQDGSQVTPEQVKTLSQTLINPNILVTANYNTPELAYKALGAGATDYLLKPFSSSEILHRVHKLVRNGKSTKVEEIADSIHAFSSRHDILKFTLDQLASTLHMTDCLVALKKQDEFRVVASRGYKPDPAGKSITLSKEYMDIFDTSTGESETIISDLTGDITRSLGISGHRPFPIIMPLVTSGKNRNGTDTIGFVLGHGPIVVNEEDLLEMERFLARISTELSHTSEINWTIHSIEDFDFEKEYLIPSSDRESVLQEILGRLQEYLKHDTDNFWVRLVIDEAVNNAIIHGHGEDLTCPVTDVKLNVSAGPGILILRIEDSGAGFNHDDVPDPTSDENLLSISGRGIFLMRNIMDEIIYNEKGTIVSMIKVLDGSPLGPLNPGLFDDFDFK